MQVLDHDGDNHLGGKDFDWLMVEQILVPRLGERFNVQSFRRDNPDPGNRRNLAKLKSLAEEVKIRLSREDSAIAVIETLGKPMMDDSDEVIEVDVSVGRPEYEAIIEPLVADTVTVARRLLERNPAVDAEAVSYAYQGEVKGPTAKVIYQPVPSLEVEPVSICEGRRDRFLKEWCMFDARQPGGILRG